MYINSKRHLLPADPSKRLIDFLREDLHLTGTKEGCGEGECGACSVVLNDEAVNSCLIPVGQLDASDKILTIEGVVKTQLGKKLVKSFLKNGAIHCGFCTPGMIVAAYVLLKKRKRLAVEEIKDAIAGNLCRCTGYEKIVESVLKYKK